jgi:hypothetical protein
MSFTDDSFNTLTVLNTTLTLLKSSATGKNLYIMGINSETSSILQTGYVASYTNLNGQTDLNNTYSSYLGVAKTTITSVVIDTVNSQPSLGELITVSFTDVPFRNYSSNNGLDSNLEVTVNTSDNELNEASRLLRANIVDSTLTITVNSGLNVDVSDVNYMVSATVLNTTNGVYVFDTPLQLTLQSATLTVSRNNVIETSVVEGETSLSSGVTYDLRTILPQLTSSATDITTSTVSLTITDPTVSFLHDNATFNNSVLNVNDVASATGVLNPDNFGASQADIDTNLATLLGSTNDRYLNITFIETAPDMVTTGANLTINTDSSLVYNYSTFGFSASQYSYNIQASKTSTDFDSTLSFASLTLGVPTGVYASNTTTYSLYVDQQIGAALYDNQSQVQVGSRLIDGTTSQTSLNTTPVITSFTSGSYVNGVSFNNASYSAVHSTQYGISYEITVSNTSTPLNSTSNIIWYESAQLYYNVDNLSAVVVLEDPLSYNRVSGLNVNYNSATSSIQQNAGNLGASFKYVSGLNFETSTSILSARRDINSQIIGGTVASMTLITKSGDYGNNDLHMRVAINYTYPDNNTDYVIADYNMANTPVTLDSDIADVVCDGTNLYIPVETDNISGYYYVIPVSASSSQSSIIQLHDNLKQILRFNIVSDGVTLATSYGDVNFDPDNVAEVTFGVSPQSSLTYYLTVQTIYQTPISDNIVVFSVSAGNYEYAIYVHNPNVSDRSVFATGPASYNNATQELTVDTYLTVKYDANIPLSVSDKIIFYYFFRPVARLTTGVYSSTPYYVDPVTTDTIIKNSISVYDNGSTLGDEVTVSGFDINNMFVGIYTFSTVALTLNLYHSGTLLSSATHSGSFQYNFLDGSDLLLALESDRIIGVHNDLWDVTLYNRRIETQVVDSSFTPISQLASVVYLVENGVPLYVSLNSTSQSVETSNNDVLSMNNVYDTGIDFSFLNTYGRGYIANKSEDNIYIKFAVSTYIVTGVPGTVYNVTASREIEPVSTNPALSSLRFTSVVVSNTTVILSVVGDAITETNTITSSSRTISNASLTTAINSNQGYTYTFPQNFLPAGYSATLTLLKPAVTTTFGSFTIVSNIINNNTQSLMVGTAHTGFNLKLNSPASLYTLVAGDVYTQVINGIQVNFYNSSGTSLIAVQDILGATESDGGIILNYQSPRVVVNVQQQNDGVYNLFFFFNLAHGYLSSVTYGLSSGNVEIWRLTRPMIENIELDSGTVTYTVEQRSISFGKDDVLNAPVTGYEPVDIDGISLQIKFLATESFMNNALVNRVFIHIDNDKAPLAVKKPDGANFSLLLANDILNVFSLNNVNSTTAVGSEVNNINVNGLPAPDSMTTSTYNSQLLISYNSLIDLNTNTLTNVPVFGENQASVFFNHSVLYNIGESRPNLTMVGNPDSLGAYPVDSTYVKLLVASDVSKSAGASWTQNSLALNGSRITQLLMNRNTLAMVSTTNAISTLYDASGNAVTSFNQIDSTRTFANSAALSSNGATVVSSATHGLSQLHGLAVHEANYWDSSNGFVDRVVLVGENVSPSGSHADDVSGVKGGLVWALDTSSGKMWAVPALGRGAHDKVALLNTNSNDHIALLFSWDDELANNGYTFTADGSVTGRSGSPLFLWIGVKHSSSTGDSNFLYRNGLSDGQLYVFKATSVSGGGSHVTVSGTPRYPSDFVDYPTSISGEFVQVTPGNNMYTLWSATETAKCYIFNDLGDVDSNPNNGSQAVIAHKAINRLELVNVSFPALGSLPSTVSATVDKLVADGDVVVGKTVTLLSPDNLSWSASGRILAQESQYGVIYDGLGNQNRNRMYEFTYNDVSDEIISYNELMRLYGNPFLAPASILNALPNSFNAFEMAEASGAVDVSPIFKYSLVGDYTGSYVRNNQDATYVLYTIKNSLMAVKSLLCVLIKLLVLNN